VSHTSTEKNSKRQTREKLRIRAEKLLTATGGDFDQISPADVRNLVLELKMRQVQLEMQNEELQRAQETITKARDRYAELYDFAPVGYFTLDRKGKIVDVNLAGAQLLGAERDLLVNRSSFRWVTPESREACRTHYRKVFDNQGPQTCEVKLRRRGGPPFYAALESVAAPGEAGMVLHCRTAMSDITLRKQAEIDLKLKERLLDGASDSIFLHDLEGHFIYVNEAACRDRGYERKELQGKDVWTLIAQNYVATREKLLQSLLAQGEITFESAHVRKDGSVMPVEIRACIIDLEDRRLVLSVARDITDRKQAEAEVQHSLEKLKKALDGTVLAVANTVEMRDPYTAGHQRQVAQLAGAIAQEMGFSPQRVEGMRVLGCLHDIGKIAIPAEILSKPGRLSRMEFTLIKDHPRVGYEIIKDIEFPFPLAEGILQHHERLNGSGYPQGISGPDIILEARILGVADVVEAMASHRPYRRALGIDRALEEISRNRGILYDHEVVDICLTLFHEKGFSFSNQPL
jgi:PAS domain S-box-containing protein/putative nucleotidyltransferase with HDIG domain